MQVKISDREALGSIPPHSLVAYVLSQGWQPAEGYGQHSTVYEKLGFPELIVPRTADIGDYEYSVSQIVSALAKIEDRSQMQIFEDLVTSDKDRIRLSATGEGQGGSINLYDGLGFINNSYLLLQSAACAAVEPKVYYRLGKNRRANGYMQKVQMGQTERGSFVVNLLAPVPPALYPDKGDMWHEVPSEPFERSVTSTFVRALMAAQEAAMIAAESRGLKSFYQSVPNGVSANLCSALADLIEHGKDLKVSLTWARTRPLETERREFVFRRSDQEIYREAARAFMEFEPRFDQTFTAYVVRLKREALEDRGHIGLQLFGEAQPLAATADVSNHLYRLAIQAHEEKKLVQVSGDLKKRGQRWHFEPLHEITLLRDLFDDWDDNTNP